MPPRSRRIALSVLLAFLCLPAAAGADFGLRSQFGGPGAGPGQFRQARNVAVDRQAGEVYVLDGLSAMRTEVFGTDGTFLRAFSDPHVFGAQDIAIGPPGKSSVWYAESSRRRVVELSLNGAFVREWGSQGSGPGQFEHISAIAVDADGSVFTADSTNHRISKFSRTGELLFEFGSAGTGPGEFAGFLYGLALDGFGQIYVGQTGYPARVMKFAADGTFLRQWGEPGDGPGQFYNPIGLSVDPAGNVWMADGGRGTSLHEFTRFGGLVRQVGGPGTEPGRFQTAFDVATDASCNVYVSDAGSEDSPHQRIQVFGETEAPFCRLGVPPEPPPGILPGETPGTPPATPPRPADTTPPVISWEVVRGAGPLRLGGIDVRVLCPTERCLMAARLSMPMGAMAKLYRFSSKRVSARAGKAVTLSIRFPKKIRAAIKRRLASGKSLKASVTVVAVDQAGNARASTRKLRLPAKK